jgi:cell division septation protein DedD
MAGLVIAVVIFLIGVQVGRGVLAQRGLPEAADATTSAAEPPPPSSSATSASSGAPVTAGEKLSYAERLASAEPAPEQLKKSDPPSPAAAVPSPKPETPPVRESAPPAAASTEPPGPGFEIQVAALRLREEAETIVKRLAGKGYPAYVVAPAKGSPTMYRVRVGKFKERREADTVAARLQKEEQFKPWVVR